MLDPHRKIQALIDSFVTELGEVAKQIALEQLKTAFGSVKLAPLPLSGSGEWRCQHTDDVYVLNDSELIRHPGSRDILKYVPGERLERMTVS